MNTLKKSILMAAAVAFMLTSCNDDGKDNHVTQQTLSGYYNIVTDLSTGASETYTGVSYGLEYNYTNQQATIVMSGLKLPNGATYPTMTSTALKWTADKDGWKKISSKTPMFAVSNYGNLPSFTNLTFDLLDRWYDDSSYACSTVIRFVVDQTYQVVSMPLQNILWGVTRVTTAGTSHVYSTESSVYVIELTPSTGLANLTINSFSLYEGGDIMAVAIKDLPYIVDGDGKISISAPTATARLVGVTNADDLAMPVTDLVFEIELGIIAGKYKIVENNTAYTVKVNN